MRYKSDHATIVLHTDGQYKERRGKDRKFKFETCWLIDGGCEEVVQRAGVLGVGCGKWSVGVDFSDGGRIE